jgi:DNA-binding transcriptional ArsR family regulator
MVQQHTSQDRLDATFSALADPTRRGILALLVSGETSVSGLAEPFEMSMPAISKHLEVLQRTGLIERGREGFAPKGFTLPSCEMDFRVGGKYRLCMRGLGRDHWVSGEHREIVPPQRIVWTGALEHEGIEVVTTVTFADLAGKTRLTVHQTFSMDTDSTRGARSG